MTEGYKQTEIGVLPEDWEVVSLKQVYDITSSKRVFQSEWKDSGVPFYRAREIAVMSEGKVAPRDLFISVEMYNAYVKQYGAISENDILITGVGTLGKVYVVKDTDQFYFKDGNIIWLQWNGKCCSNYIKHLYDTPLLQRQVHENAGGSTVGTYTITNAKDTLIPFPPLPEQRRIAEALSDVDELIASLEKLIAKKKAIKQGAMQELLTGKRRLPGFSGEWESCALKDIAGYSTAMVPMKGISILDYIGTDNMISNKGGIRNNEITIEYTVVREYRNGDILLSNIRPYLKIIWHADKDGGCSNDVLVIRVNNPERIEPAFLYYLLSQDSFFEEVMANAVGTKMPRGDKAVIMGYCLRIPKESYEQTAIVGILRDLDNSIEQLSQQLNKYLQIKQGMMQLLLTGKIRV